MLGVYEISLTVEPKRSYLVVKKKDNDGKLHDQCIITWLPFSKSGNNVQVVSNCLFESSCYSKNKIPTKEDLKEIEELCSGFFSMNNSKC